MTRLSSKTHQLPPRTPAALCAIASVLLLLPPHTPAQQPAPEPQRRIHLILRDGSYQLVTDYRVDGSNVLYHSAERAGAEEIIPLRLVDLDGTHAWEQRHSATSPQSAPPPIDPELLREEAARAALTPAVAPDLYLPEQDSVLALDTFQGSPELVPLAQSDGALNRNTAHNILAGLVNPLSSPHPVVTLKGPRAVVQLHVPDPVLYVRVGDDADLPSSGTAFTVDTHGNTANAPTASAGGSATSRYVIVRADVRIDTRVLLSFSPAAVSDGRPLPEDVTPTRADPLPGGHWLRLTPTKPLDFGEFALVEVLDDRRLNLGVWDFGVHPAAPENRDVLRPEPRRHPALNRGTTRPDQPLTTH